MSEEETIKYATIYLDGIAHEWWHHDMTTTGYDRITSYAEITERLTELFGKKDPKLHFKELAQLKKWSSVDTYIAHFRDL
jgi:hypothetical protein